MTIATEHHDDYSLLPDHKLIELYEFLTCQILWNEARIRGGLSKYYTLDDLMYWYEARAQIRRERYARGGK